MKKSPVANVAALLRSRLERWRTERRPHVLPLESVRRRLELLLVALHGREIVVDSVPEPKRRGLLGRLRLKQANQRWRVAQSDATTIHLPATIDASDGEDAAIARYRVLALAHAQRIARGSARVAPGDDRRLEHDLFQLRESVSAERSVAQLVPSSQPRIIAERTRALQCRPPLRKLRAGERQVERLIRAALAATPESPPEEIGYGDSADDSVVWAQAMATRIRAESPGEYYRGIVPVSCWGMVIPTAPPLADPSAMRTTHREGATPGAASDVSPSEVDPLRPVTANPDLVQQWNAALRQSNLDPLADRELTPDGEATDTLHDAGENLVRSEGEGGVPDDALHPDDAVSSPVDIGDPSDATWRARTVMTIPYPEWDLHSSRTVPRHVTVRIVRPDDAESEWSVRAMREHAPLVRHVRHRFERLRARRIRLSAQREGEEIDVGACVNALVERAAGHAGDDRLYVAVRPARRPIAIVLLVDVSGSTDAPITSTLRIIDVEKTALLIAGEALEAMGDPFAMLAFSGRGARDVRIATLKDFSERYGESARRRVSALEARGNTRLGAAIRHASAILSRQPAGHRLLLLLSDGQPNDSDRYQGDYGIEDARQSVHEARERGVFPFCITVDREGPEYLPRIFGAAGHTILRKPDQLPTALLDVVRALVAE